VGVGGGRVRYGTKGSYACLGLLVAAMEKNRMAWLGDDSHHPTPARAANHRGVAGCDVQCLAKFAGHIAVVADFPAVPWFAEKMGRAYHRWARFLPTAIARRRQSRPTRSRSPQSAGSRAHNNLAWMVVTARNRRCRATLMSGVLAKRAVEPTRMAANWGHARTEYYSRR